MNYIRHLSGFFEKLAEDRRMTPYHVSLYVCLFRYWNLNRFRNSFPISREELMDLSRIGSTNTYARCMKQLNEWGYIEYSPTGNFHTGIQVSCISFDMGADTRSNTGSNIGTDTGGDTGSNTRPDTGSDTRSDTLLINSINKRKQNKQSPDFFENERRKKSIVNNPYHVENDKDYGEPL
jgi:hypothetical protein